MRNEGNLAYVKPTTVDMTYVSTLLRPSLPAIGESVGTITQLLLVEEVLDELAANRETATVQYQYLTCKAKAFIQANPDLLKQPWLRNGGAVYDLIQELRERQLRAIE